MNINSGWVEQYAPGNIKKGNNAVSCCAGWTRATWEKYSTGWSETLEAFVEV